MQRAPVPVVVLLSVASMCQARSFEWSGGISITKQTNQSGIFSRIEARRDGGLVGCWFSTSGVLPQVFNGLQVHAFGDFPGIRKIQKVELSPDHGLTRWSAELVEGKGYAVTLPYLPPGAYGLEWGVWSKDQRNRLILVIIPINWSSVRYSAAANHLMVQQQPLGWQHMSPSELFAHLRGFVFAWATPDPAFLTRQQASQDMIEPASAETVPAPPAPAPARSEPEEVGELETVAGGASSQMAPVGLAATLPHLTERSRPVPAALSLAHQQASQAPSPSGSGESILPPPQPGLAQLDREVVRGGQTAPEDETPEVDAASAIASRLTATLPRLTGSSGPMQVMLIMASSAGRQEIPVTMDMRRIQKGSRVSFRNRDDVLVEAEVVRVIPGRAIVLKTVGSGSTELAFGRICEDVPHRGDHISVGGDVS